VLKEQKKRTHMNQENKNNSLNVCKLLGNTPVIESRIMPKPDNENQRVISRKQEITQDVFSGNARAHSVFFPALGLSFQTQVLHHSPLNIMNEQNKVNPRTLYVDVGAYIVWWTERELNPEPFEKGSSKLLLSIFFGLQECSMFCKYLDLIISFRN
jgi:hypothetical protein